LGFRLTVLAGPEEGREYTFERIEITIGRTMENDVVLPDPGISRQHLSIRDKGGAYILKDLGSSNGTLLNGRKVLEEVLKSGDVITIGGAKVRFEAEESKASRPAKKPARQRQTAPRGRSQNRKPQKRLTPARPAKQSGAVIRSAGMRKRTDPRAQKESGQAAEVSRTAPSRRAGRPAKKGAGPLTELVAKGVTWFKGLNKRMQIVLIAVAGLLFLLIVVKLFQGGRDFVRGSTDHSDEEFMPGQYDSDGEAFSYGLGPVTILCREKATFKFKYANGRATMTYAVAGIESGQEVAIQLNGMLVDHAPVTLGKWSDYIRLNLPRKHLLENEENRVTFLNMANYNNADAEENWGVEVESIEETPPPPPDKEAAAEAFKIAKERYKTKNVAPPNLYRALGYFKKARDYLELIPKESRPEIYLEANEMVHKIEKELEARFKNYRFEAEREKNRNRLDKAKNIYRQLMLTFPDTEDPRHLYAKELFEEIAE
jgi:pSer/pThr/pTyr-binding forkhead associated (FHA) protein